MAHTRSLGVLLLALGATLVTAACGSTGASTGTPAATPPTPAATGPAPAPRSASNPTAVVAGKASNSLAATLLDLAKQRGFYGSGVTVQDPVIHGSTAVVAAISANSAQFGFVSASALLLARQKGFDDIAVAGVTSGTPLQLVVSRTLAVKAGVTARSSLARRMELLNGAVLGNSGPTDQGAFQLLFSAAGVHPRVRFVHTGGQAEALAAMRNGELQAFFQSPPSSVEAVASGVAMDLVRGDEVPGWRTPVYQVLIASAPWVRAHPAAARAVATGLGRATFFAVQHSKQLLTFEEHYYPTLKPAVLQQSLAIFHFDAGATMTAAQWGAARKIAIGEHFLAASTPAGAGSAWTNAYLAG